MNEERLMQTVGIKLENLEKGWITLRGKVTALKKVDLEIKEGEFFVLLGPSGCGKSTLLNILAGLEKPTTGKLIFGDQTVACNEEKIFMEPFERDVAMVFQSYALYPHMTIEENIQFPLTNLKPRPSKEEMKKQSDEVAELLQITDLLDRKPSELSGGQRQRVAIGRAIVRKPRIFLMDEPLSNLDAQLRTDMRAQLKSLQQELGITTIYVTHDQLEAMTLGDRIAILNEGIVQQMGTPIDVYRKPANTFIARFIGSPSMNLFSGDFDGKSGLQCDDISIELPASVSSRLKEHGGSRFTLGIRPEDIKLTSPGAGNMDADIKVIEHIGNENLLYAFFKHGVQVVIKTEDDPGHKKVGLKLEADRIHIFDIEQQRV